MFSKQDCVMKGASLLAFRNQEVWGTESHSKLLFKLGSKLSPCLHSSSNHFTAFKTSSVWAAERKKRWILPVTFVIRLKGTILSTSGAVEEYLCTIVGGGTARVKKETSSKGGSCAEQCLLFCFTNGSYGNLRTLTYAVIASREHQSK